MSFTYTMHISHDDMACLAHVLGSKAANDKDMINVLHTASQD